jgi:hypothetical protein
MRFSQPKCCALSKPIRLNRRYAGRFGFSFLNYRGAPRAGFSARFWVFSGKIDVSMRRKWKWIRRFHRLSKIILESHHKMKFQSLSIVLSMILLLLPLLQLIPLLSSRVDCVVGNAWIEVVDVNEHKIGQLSMAMWLALRREMQSALAYQQHRNKA